MGEPIWQYLNSVANDGRRLVVIGDPGSGKTTLLRQMAMRLSKHQVDKSADPIPNRLPIFLTLREHEQTILRNPKVKLADVIHGALTRLDKSAPAGWFSNQLENGRCIVMMDGLDEVAGARDAIVKWVQLQMEAYPKSHFVVTSRRYGYRYNPLMGVEVLEIKPFTSEQVREFIRHWYLANEIKRSQRNDLGTQIAAEKNSDELIRRLEMRPALKTLAINPLLATMIVTVHNYTLTLPGQRVELYRDIFSVILERRKVVWLSQLSKDQKLEVLHHLAYQMMRKGVSSLPRSEARESIRDVLASTGVRISGEEFLDNIKDHTGFLVEEEADKFAFAHKTFQEYLASVHIVQDKANLEGELLNFIEDAWWAETIRLYAAQTDATSIVQSCLERDLSATLAFSLAIDCLAEAKTIRPDIRYRLETILDQAMESTSNQRALVADARLSSRLRWMIHWGRELSIDTGLVTNIEYQLFLDDMQKNGEYFYPDHWLDERFPETKGKDHVVGVRPRDVERFCEWLLQRYTFNATFRVPTIDEVSVSPISNSSHTVYWITSNGKSMLYSEPTDTEPNSPAFVFQIRGESVSKQLDADVDRFSRLWEARKEREKPRRTSADLLSGPWIPQGGGQSFQKSAVSAREREFELLSLRSSQNAFLLKEFEIFAGTLSLPFDIMLQALVSTFVARAAEARQLRSWLPERNYIFLDEFDLEDKFDSTIILLQGEEARHALGVDAQVFIDSLVRGIALLRTREWAGVVFDDPRDRRRLYEFVRWYVRICSASCGAIANRRLPLTSGFGAIHREVILNCENLLVTLTLLEERIAGKQPPIEGVRLVKVQRS